jgi:hypothetical protein
LHRRGQSEDRKRFERRQVMAPRPLAVRGEGRALTIREGVDELEETSQPETNAEPVEGEKAVDTTTVEHSTFARGKTLDQSQSRLMQLPYELRQMIWRATIGDSTFHMILKRNKLGHIRCKAPSAVDCPLGYNGTTLSRECCWGTVDSANIWLPSATHSDEGTDGDLLPLLQSCRQMYVQPSIPKLNYER